MSDPDPSVSPTRPHGAMADFVVEHGHDAEVAEFNRLTVIAERIVEFEARMRAPGPTIFYGNVACRWVADQLRDILRGDR